jgi:hypothetical protein
MEWISQFWESLTWSRIFLGTLALIVSVAISYGAIILVMVKIPADYFSSTYAINHQNDQHFLLRWGATIFKNLVGVVLIVVGVVMIVGPGPGVLTILLGLIMLDIPGKRPLEASLIKRPAVLTPINNLRARYQKPPLILD